MMHHRVSFEAYKHWPTPRTTTNYTTTKLAS
jgi:hypothetical protein